MVLLYGGIHEIVQDSRGVVSESQISQISVTGNYKNDAMMRQIMKSVRIKKSSNEKKTAESCAHDWN